MTKAVVLWERYRQEFRLYQCSNSCPGPGTRRMMDTSRHGGVSTGPSGSRWDSPRIVLMDWETMDGIPSWHQTGVGQEKEGRRKERLLLRNGWATSEHGQAVLGDIKCCVTLPQVESGSVMHTWYILKVMWLTVLIEPCDYLKKKNGM